MIFDTLKIENFLTIGSIECSLNNKGLVLIQGENKDDSSQDSNGSGKSSFPDAISWCLYGTTARGESGDKIVNRTAKKNCRVSVTLKDEDVLFHITRHRKHSEHKNRLIVTREENGVETDLTKGTDKLTQETVDKIVGCSEDVFQAAIYAGQEAMPDLPGMTDKQLKLLVEEAAGIDKLQEAHSIAKTRLREAKSNLDQANIKLSGLKQNVASIQDSNADLEDNFKRHEDNRALRIAEISSHLKDRKNDLARAMALRDKADEKLKEIQAAITRVTEKIDAVDQEKVRESELQLELQKASVDVATNKRAYQQALDKVKRDSYKCDSIMDSIGKPCDECGKPYTESDMSEVKRKAEESKKEALSLAKASKSQYLEAQESYQKARETILEFQANMTDVSSEVQRRDELSTKAAKLQETHTTVKSIKEDIAEKLKALSSLKTEENPYETLIESGKSRLESRQLELKQQELEVSKYEKEIRISEGTEKVFGPAGVRAHILDTVTPFLNHRTAEYLGTLTDENITATWNTLSTTAKGDLREKFVIEVNSKVGASNFRSLSGGEKRKVRLACSMALQDLVSSRASKPIELYIADEIDHALDEAGLERLMSILDDKAKAKGTALVISHNSLSDWIRKSVSVVKESGFSKMVGEL